MTPALPLAHHLVQAIPVLLPAVILPIGLAVWTVRDRRQARAERDADLPARGTPPRAPSVG